MTLRADAVGLGGSLARELRVRRMADRARRLRAAELRPDRSTPLSRLRPARRATRWTRANAAPNRAGAPRGIVELRSTMSVPARLDELRPGGPHASGSTRARSGWRRRAQPARSANDASIASRIVDECRPRRCARRSRARSAAPPGPRRTPTTDAAPSFAAAIASTPEPVPTSITRRSRQLDALQQRQAQPRRFVMAGAEAGGRIDDDGDVAVSLAVRSGGLRSSTAARRRCGRRGSRSGSPGSAAPTLRPARRRRRSSADDRRALRAAQRRRHRGVWLTGRRRASRRRTRRSWMACGSKSSSSAWRSSQVSSRRARRAGPPAEVQRREAQPKMSLTRSKNGLSLAVLAVEVVLLLRQRLRQLLEQVLLFLGELLRDGDAGDDVQIAVAAARDVRHALAAQLEARARLRAGRDVQLFAPVERRDLDAAAERERRVTDRQLAEEVVAFAVEELVVLHVHDDVEIAREGRRRCRARPRSGGAGAGRWRCPAGIFTVSLRSRPTRPAPRQVWHGLAIVLPVPRQFEHGRATVRKPCW